MEKIEFCNSDIDLVRIESSYKTIFGARPHSMICACSLGIPVAGFIWDEKVVHFAEMVHLEDYFLKEIEVPGKDMYEVLLKVFNSIDDVNNRNLWRNKTKDSIFEFLKYVDKEKIS